MIITGVPVQYCKRFNISRPILVMYSSPLIYSQHYCRLVIYVELLHRPALHVDSWYQFRGVTYVINLITVEYQGRLIIY